MLNQFKTVGCQKGAFIKLSKIKRLIFVLYVYLPRITSYRFMSISSQTSAKLPLFRSLQTSILNNQPDLERCWSFKLKVRAPKHIIFKLTKLLLLNQQRWDAGSGVSSLEFHEDCSLAQNLKEQTIEKQKDRQMNHRYTLQILKNSTVCA